MPIPIPRGTRPPRMPPTGNIYSDIGKGLIQGGENLQDVIGQMNAEDSRRAKIEDMVNRRKLALRAQRSKEEFQQLDVDYKQQLAEQGQKEFEETEARRVAHEARLKETSDVETAEKEYRRDARRDLSREIFQLEEKSGKPLKRDQIRLLAAGWGIGDEWEQFAGDRPYNPYSFRKSQGKTKEKTEEAVRSIPYREEELNNLIKDFNNTIGMSFETSRFISNPMEIEKEIRSLPADSEKRKSLQKKFSSIQVAIKRVNDAKIKAKIDYKTEDSTVDKSQELAETLKRVEEKRKRLESLRTYQQ